MPLDQGKSRSLQVRQKLGHPVLDADGHTQEYHPALLAYELVEHGLVDELDFRDFTFTKMVKLHGGLNLDFFEGTLIEAEAAKVLKEL